MGGNSKSPKQITGPAERLLLTAAGESTPLKTFPTNEELSLFAAFDLKSIIAVAENARDEELSKIRAAGLILLRDNDNKEHCMSTSDHGASLSDDGDDLPEFSLAGRIQSVLPPLRRSPFMPEDGTRKEHPARPLLTAAVELPAEEALRLVASRPLEDSFFKSEQSSPTWSGKSTPLSGEAEKSKCLARDSHSSSRTSLSVSVKSEVLSSADLKRVAIQHSYEHNEWHDVDNVCTTSTSKTATEDDLLTENSACADTHTGNTLIRSQIASLSTTTTSSIAGNAQAAGDSDEESLGFFDDSEKQTYLYLEGLASEK
ncbi:hypothetical protein CC86DRAFT_470420 [Ophiobolus disseminans]|uniref:Uncharacterized protein n=1 Tax=Ophiobolus disseminans TaxID=1469910 RepID=A0A6A6ZLC2_9PLEO|nr:hypothetical protein CC86DRAFT_470420 [Ophiobolus disseminans]